MVNVRASPAINSLIVIACHVHPLRLFIQLMSNVPLQGRQVLRFIQKAYLQRGHQMVSFLGKTHNQVCKVHQAKGAFVVGVRVRYILHFHPREVDVGVVVLMLQRGFLGL